MKVITTVILLAGSWVQAEVVPVWFGTGADGIYLSEIDGTTGELTAAQRAAEVSSPGFLALRPGGGFLYAAAREGKVGRVVGYQITKERSLKHLSTQDSGGSGACHLDLTPDGKTILVANYGSGSVSSFGLEEDGTFAEAVSEHQHEGASVHPRQKSPHAHGFFAGPGGNKAYAPDLGTDEVVIYALDGGATKKVKGWKMPPGTGPRHLKFGKEGKQIYVLGELSLTVVVGDLDDEGMPTQSQVIPVLDEGRDGSEMTCSEIRVHPNGRFVYVATRDLRGEGRGALTVFEVKDDGKLKRIQIVSAEVDIPRNFALDPSGRWLLVAGQKSGQVPVFAVGEDGLLKFSQRKIEVPTPMCVVFGE